jgi:3-methyladenine DNA glycosylase AlkD
MLSQTQRLCVKAQAAEIARELQDLPAAARDRHRLRRRISRQLVDVSGGDVMDLARELWGVHGRRWFAYALIRHHQQAFASLDEAAVEALGQGIDSWGSVDSYARTLSGPAWLHGLISDDLIHRWARSPDRWWRRAALVSTVALNVRSHGGMGDTERTLAVCETLVDDRDDMVYKALSWALRALVAHDPEAVRAFLARYGDRMAAQARREVRNKLETGLKNPRRSAGRRDA